VVRKCLVSVLVGSSCQGVTNRVKATHLNSSEAPKAVVMDVLEYPEVGEG